MSGERRPESFLCHLTLVVTGVVEVELLRTPEMPLFKSELKVCNVSLHPFVLNNVEGGTAPVEELTRVVATISAELFTDYAKAELQQQMDFSKIENIPSTNPVGPLAKA